MIASMTGFARREVSGSWGSLVCELRSVNHRFLETSFRLPDALRSLEPDLRQRIARALRRGKVDCTLTLKSAAGAEASLDVDPAVLDRLLARVRGIGGALPDHYTVDVLDVLRWPGVMRDAGGSDDALIAAARAVFDATLEELGAARAREGDRLCDLIEQRCAALDTQVASVRGRLPEIRTRALTRLHERLAELKVSVDPGRLEQELAILLQRLDADEELDRLSGHIAETRRVVQGNEPAGRRLDFLMQELNREANTLSSKSQDLETTRLAVEMKVLVEQMREQVQNIE